MTFKKSTFYFKSLLASLAFLFVFSFLPTQVDAATATFGTTTVGASTDTGMGNSITCNRYAAGSSGTLSSFSVRVGNVDSAANAYSLAIYANSTSNAPTTKLGSATGTLTANAWNTLSISAPIVAGSNYWLCYNTKTTKAAYNNIKYASGSTPAIYKAQTYGTWPSTFGTVGASWTSAYSVYATVTLAAPTVTPTKTPTPTPTKTPTPTPTKIPTPTATAAPTPTTAPQPSTAPTSLTSGGTYTLVNQCGAMVASVPNSSTDDAAVLQTAVSNGGANQQWVITGLGSGYYKLLNKNSGKAMDIAFGATTDSALAIQYPSSDATSQQWKIVNYGTYYKLYARHSNKALDVWLGSAAAGINIQQYSENNSCAQQWKLQSVNVPTPTVAPTATPTPAPVCSTPAPTTAAGYETLIRGAMNGRWYHGDFGGSVMLPNGKTLWVFGDTIIGDAAAQKGNAAIHNSAILVDKGCASILSGTLPDGKDTAWVNPPASMDVPDKDDYYWLNTPFMDGTTLRAFLGHLYNDADGFHPIGADLATYTIENGVPKLSSVVETPGSASYGLTPVWGAGVISDGGYNYILGSMSKNEPLVFGHYYYVARVPVGSTTDKSAWEFWNGSSWVTNQTEVTPIINGVAGLAAGVTIYKNAAGEFVIISKKADSFGTDLVAWKATTITGPWTEVTPPLMSPVPQPNYTTQDYTYLGLGHPWINLSSGKMLVSWSLGSNDASFFGDSRYGVYFSEVDKP